MNIVLNHLSLQHKEYSVRPGDLVAISDESMGFPLEVGLVVEYDASELESEVDYALVEWQNPNKTRWVDARFLDLVSPAAE